MTNYSSGSCEALCRPFSIYLCAIDSISGVIPEAFFLSWCNLSSFLQKGIDSPFLSWTISLKRQFMQLLILNDNPTCRHIAHCVMNNPYIFPMSSMCHSPKKAEPRPVRRGGGSLGSVDPPCILHTIQSVYPLHGQLASVIIITNAPPTTVCLESSSYRKKKTGKIISNFNNKAKHLLTTISLFYS